MENQLTWEETVDSWKERLPEIVKGYAKEDIWNMDEMGVFYLIVVLGKSGSIAWVLYIYTCMGV